MTTVNEVTSMTHIKDAESEESLMESMRLVQEVERGQEAKEGSPSPSPCPETSCHIGFDVTTKGPPQDVSRSEAGSGSPKRQQFETSSRPRSAFEVDLDQCPITRVVMLAIDSSKHADHALEWASTNFISPSSDLVVLVHVRDIPPAPTYGSTIAIDYGFLISGLDGQYRTASHALLKQAAAKLRHVNKKLAVKAISIRGEPREELIRKANEIQADVIIVGSQGKGFVKRTILGSTTDFLVHHAKCTVLVVKMPGE